ncbi:methionine aminopeptidase 1D, mitochondrial isoform X2 [Adelges cooleyi]|uniref:methionine aminopeptidase 1D, mitochondrial isoform X2 n=1 Tax=Adelges cooleyi TaxID=133065 RepID=UPI00217F7638|nr:methionine aminopeptidase 1D, mitochondrial isoform X2 [Adelges cooleyi]
MILFKTAFQQKLLNSLCARYFWSKSKQTYGVYDIVSLGIVTDEPESNDDCSPEIKTKGQIEMMRQSCKLAKFVLDSARSQIKTGITTDEIDEFVHDLIINNNAYPSPLNYKGFMKSVCTSINNILCHGVPDNRPLHDGDIISVDVSVYLNGFHGDCAATYCVGDVDEQGKKLVSIAEQCMYNGINVCKPGKSFSEISKAIELYAYNNEHRVIPCITGHGIGTFFHGPPTIFHTTQNTYPGLMEPGMIFTIEPVVIQGTSSDIAILDDGWSIATLDDSRGAQFEHTVLITENGCDILTV